MLPKTKFEASIPNGVKRTVPSYGLYCTVYGSFLQTLPIFEHAGRAKYQGWAADGGQSVNVFIPAVRLDELQAAYITGPTYLTTSQGYV